MKRKISLPVIMGLALLLAVLLSAGLVKAGWDRSDPGGPAIEILRFCPDGARIGLLLSDGSNRTGTWHIKITKDDQELARQPIELQTRSSPIPDPFNLPDQKTHIYNYVTFQWHIEAGTVVDIFVIDPSGIEEPPILNAEERAVSQCTDRDDFNRQGPRLGENWRGATSRRHYRINNEGQVEVVAGGPIFWQREGKLPFGVEQEAQVKLVKIDPQGRHRLLLKVQPDEQGNPDWRRGAIAVFYDARRQQVGIETFTSETRWQTVETFDYIMGDGDQLAGRIVQNDWLDSPNETVFVFVNDQLIGAAVTEVFAEEGGSIGLWFSPGPDRRNRAVFDDFEAVDGE